MNTCSDGNDSKKQKHLSELYRMRYVRNRKKILADGRQYFREHREEMNCRRLERYHQDMRDPEKRKKENARKYTWYHEHLEQAREYGRQSSKKYREKKKNKASEEEKEKKKAYQRNYYATHREEILRRRKNYRAITKSLRTDGIECEIQTAIALENLNV